MVEILNKLRQPLTINLSNGESLVLLSKEKVEIPTELFKSEEIKLHLAKENIIVLRMS